MHPHSHCSRNFVRLLTAIILVVLSAGIAGSAVPARVTEAVHCVQCELIVPPGTTLRLTDDRTVNCVLIGVLATLKTNGHTLTLAGGQASIIQAAGILELDGGNPTLAVVDSDHTLSGAGRVVCSGEGAGIQIEAGLTLTNEVKIEGAASISSSGAFATYGGFVNDGLVVANRTNGTMHIRHDVDLKAGSGLWMVITYESAAFQFDGGSQCDVEIGDLRLQTGTLQVETDVTFDEFRWDGGVIDSALENVQLQYDKYDPASAKPNPRDGSFLCNQTEVDYEFVNDYPKF